MRTVAPMTPDGEALRRHLHALEHGERSLQEMLARLSRLDARWPGVARLARSAERRSRSRAAYLARRTGSRPAPPCEPQQWPANAEELARELRDVGLRLRALELGWTALADARPLADLGLSSFAAKALRQIDIQQQNFTPPQHAASDHALARTPGDMPDTIPTIRDQFWVPVVGALLVGAVGIVSWLAHTAWLLPSLGPSAYLLAIQPSHPTARPYNVVVGHLLGLGAGFLAVEIIGCRLAPGIAAHHLVLSRAFAAMLAMALSLFAVLALEASHPPAGATTLLVTLGALKTSADAVHLIIGVALLAAIGELARLLRLGHVKVRPMRAPAPLRPRRA